MAIEVLIEEAQGETAVLDFKATFNPKLLRDWCELVKDIVAMANSGGGIIVIGADDDGEPNGLDVQPILDIDPATIADKIYKYTDTHAIRCRVSAHTRKAIPVCAFCVEATPIPIVFAQAGTYEAETKQKSAFAQGAVYFRHGAKSEPGTTEDLRAALERELERIRSSWLDGIAKVITAPAGSVVSVTPIGDVKLTGDEGATPIKLVNDATAPTYKLEATDALYPYRLKEAAAAINQLLQGVKISTHDVTCVRKVHEVDTNPTFFHKPKYSSPQYSQAFVDWMVDAHAADNEFFLKARASLKQLFVST